MTLTEDDVRLIRDCVEERDRLKEQIAKLKQDRLELSNKYLAEKLDLTVEEVRKVVQYQVFKEI